MVFSKKIIAIAAAVFLGAAFSSANGAPVKGAPSQGDVAAVSSGLGLELIGVSKTPAGAFVILQDSKTGKRGVYKAGSHVRGAKIVEVSREAVVFEKDGVRQSVPLRKSAAVNKPAGLPEGFVSGGPEKFPGVVGPGENTFDPVALGRDPSKEGGPPPELPYFEPTTNETGPLPPVPEGFEQKELPQFEPVESPTGPVAE